MAKDITMIKGNEKISISPDFLEHYKKLGFKTEEKNAIKKDEKVVKQSEKKEA
tara:strand:+ start:156 stop:314 length:159 start_codon:yes stop_codon:yes gene_type:complete